MYNADLIIDVRKIHNKSNKKLGSNIRKNICIMMHDNEIKDFYDNEILALVNQLLNDFYDNFEKAMNSLTYDTSSDIITECEILIGCHEGKHRSVLFIEQLYNDIINDDRFMIHKNHMNLYD